MRLEAEGDWTSDYGSFGNIRAQVREARYQEAVSHEH